jgi:hypothetical protein
VLVMNIDDVSTETCLICKEHWWNTEMFSTSCIESHGRNFSTYYKFTLSVINRNLKFSGHVSIWTSSCFVTWNSCLKFVSTFQFPLEWCIGESVSTTLNFKNQCIIGHPSAFYCKVDSKRARRRPVMRAMRADVFRFACSSIPRQQLMYHEKATFVIQISAIIAKSPSCFTSVIPAVGKQLTNRRQTTTVRDPLYNRYTAWQLHKNRVRWSHARLRFEEEQKCHVFEWLRRGFGLVNQFIGSLLTVTTNNCNTFKITIIITHKVFNSHVKSSQVFYELPVAVSYRELNWSQSQNHTATDGQSVSQ